MMADTHPLRAGYDWYDDAACNGADRADWFPERGAKPEPYVLHTCNGCPVRDQCLRHAINNNIAHGVWGGLTTRQRAKLRRMLHVAR